MEVCKDRALITVRREPKDVCVCVCVCARVCVSLREMGMERAVFKHVACAMLCVCGALGR